MDPKMRKKKEKLDNRVMKKQELQCYREQLDRLVEDERRSQLSFPPTLCKGTRKKLHTYAHSIGLKSKSSGLDEDRFLIVYKKNAVPYVPVADGTMTYLRLSDDTTERISKLQNDDPVSAAEKEMNILRPTQSQSQSHAHLPFMFGDSRTKPRLTIPPKTNGDQQFTNVRQSLPIFEYRNNILAAIDQHQVVVISGETGSGKTTQVPQYIMEEFSMRDQECRIICTQPRRLAATSIATRVSQERNDNLGRSVGYQIRLDSRVTSTTNLIFTTSGFLLRCLTGSKQDEVYKNLTHLILDEVHEREKVTDFLLIAIRDALQANPHLKVILMSATLDSEQFSKYFSNCPVINVPGRLFDVDVMHLGEVLSLTGFKTKQMNVYMAENQMPKILRTNKTNAIECENENEESNVEISEDDIQFYDECFDDCMAQDDDTPFDQIYCLITDENMSVDYMHSTKFRTALGIAAEKGFYDVLTKLLGLGANPTFKDKHDKTALDYADEHEQEECCELLTHYQYLEPIKAVISDDDDNAAREKALQQFTVLAYQMTNSQPRDEIDHELLQTIIMHIHTEKPIDGSILVFLPGYEDIMTQKEMIETRFQFNNYQLFVLHSGVNGTNSAEQSRVFECMPMGIRKIILSTNIAETSLTINDVVYVIDAGKVKQLSYDSISESTCLTSTVISQACAKQRTGRAGRIRKGYCYRLYSLEQYEAMEKYTLPEILRVPLTEICLNAKMLSGDLSIEDFLLKALQSPSVKNIRQSIELLKKINALDTNENITYLGIHLANMPVDCQLGKMILYAIVLQCLDPVIIIVSALSVKDPFMLPLGNEGTKISQIKKEFSRNSLSDHQMLLNTFEEWLKNKRQHDFCHDNYISHGNMQMIQGVRRLIMGHLKMANFISEGTSRCFRKLNENSQKWEVVKACLTAGLYPNICRFTSLGGQIYSKQDKKLAPHLSSILRDRGSRGQVDRNVLSADAEWLIHGEKCRISHLSLIRNITVVPAIDIALFAGPISLAESALVSGNDGKREILSDMDCDVIPDEDDLYNTDHDDELFAYGGENNETTLIIDDWISFTIDDNDAKLLFYLRQKFASMFVKFLHDPVTVQITPNDIIVLNVLLEVIRNEDYIEKHIKNKIEAAVNAEAENDVGGYPEPIRKIERKPIPDRPSGPVIPILSTVYSQAIEPDNQRNKNKKKKKKQNKKNDRKNQVSRSDEKNWRQNDVPDNLSQITQPSNASTSSKASSFNPQRNLTQGPFHEIDQPSLTLSDYSFGPHSSAMTNSVTVPAHDMVMNRYFILTVKHVGQIYSSVFNRKWQFKTPMNIIRKVAEQSSPAKIILFWCMKKKIFGYGEFKAQGSRNYIIILDQNIKQFRPLMEFDADEDNEMAPEQGYQIHTKCMNLAKLNASSF